MELINNTNMVTGYTIGAEPSGRESAVVVVKASFQLPAKPGVKPVLLDHAVPLIEADIFSGEPGLSSPLYEVDFAPSKQACDVSLIGSVYAPGGKATVRVQAGFKIGKQSKVLDVLGDRYWVASATSWTTSTPALFLRRAITYDIAFGGVDRCCEDASKHDPYMLNPVGIGYHRQLDRQYVDNTPAPCTEESGRPISNPDGLYWPMSFGPIGRAWSPRAEYAGTYDEQWLERTFPFLPADFDSRYYQSVPMDQQFSNLKGGEEVMLLNVTEDGKRSFMLPEIDIPVVFFKRKSERVETRAVLDTLVLEPDLERFTMTWRAKTPLKRNLFEIPEVLVGKASAGWWRARALGKDYFGSLQELVVSKRESGRYTNQKSDAGDANE